MTSDFAQADRISPLQPLATPAISPSISILQAKYKRPVLPHYQGNSYIREEVDIQVILVEGGSLVVPSTPTTSFLGFYHELKGSNSILFQRILSPSGAAKSASTDHLTPIKEITQMRLAGLALPGDRELYGWYEMEKEAAQKGYRLELLFQGNGLYFNRGSVLYDGVNLLAYPDFFLAEILEMGPSPETRARLAIGENSFKRPLLFFIASENGRMAHFLHYFHLNETYRQGLKRLLEAFRKQRARCAFAASPPLVIPSDRNDPVYLSLWEILSRFHANDVRHSLYCPYEGAVLLSAELGRGQCLEAELLSASISERAEDRIRLRLAETLNFVTTMRLRAILEKKGYTQRYSFSTEDGVDFLNINPLEGVYSHLLPFLTQQGQFGLIQTSGTRGNITGNDGPTLRQLSAILRDLNAQPPFDRDPIVAAASGSQGNDVPNIVCRSRMGNPDLLHALAPETMLDENHLPRGIVTTPRVGIIV